MFGGFRRIQVHSTSRAYARGWVGVKKLIFYENVITCGKEIKCFAYFLLVNLST